MIDTKKFLPIGTVVMLKGGKKKLMITGFCSVDFENQDKVYDYNSCMYPEGYLDSKRTCLFDHEQIEKIYSLGYSDEEQVNFKNKLDSLLIKENN